MVAKIAVCVKVCSFVNGDLTTRFQRIFFYSLIMSAARVLASASLSK